MKKYISYVVFIFLSLNGANQTTTIDTPSSQESLPFRIRISEARFSLPEVESSTGGTTSGIQAFAFGRYKNKGFFIGGRTSGLHWLNDTDSFLATQQNTTLYVIDFATQTLSYRSLNDPNANITEMTLDLLTTTASEYVQLDNFLFMIGGYGYNCISQDYDTKNSVNIIDLPKAINWVEGGKGSFYDCLTIIYDPYLKVTGGDCFNTNRHKPTLLCLGQNYNGSYRTNVNGEYTEQIRGIYFPTGNSEKILKNVEVPIDPNYRRRDLNSVPIMVKKDNSYVPAVICFSGVFTLDGGIWTIPIVVDENGNSFMQDPNDPNTLKQGMNNYNCASASLFSIKRNESYVLFFGGISFQYAENGTFFTDSALPFINNVTTVVIDNTFFMQQYLMDSLYPTIFYPNSSNPSYFGTYGKFIPTYSKQFCNGVISFDTIKGGEEVLLGYIIGGIQSSARNTGGVPGTSISSAHIFEVYLTKR